MSSRTIVQSAWTAGSGMGVAMMNLTRRTSLPTRESPGLPSSIEL